MSTTAIINWAHVYLIDLFSVNLKKEIINTLHASAFRYSEPSTYRVQSCSLTKIIVKFWLIRSNWCLLQLPANVTSSHGTYLTCVDKTDELLQKLHTYPCWPEKNTIRILPEMGKETKHKIIRCWGVIWFPLEIRNINNQSQRKKRYWLHQNDTASTETQQ